MINLGTLNDITVSNDDFLPISIIKQVKKLHRYQYVLGGVMPIVTFVATLAAMVRGIDILYGMMDINVFSILVGIAVGLKIKGLEGHYDQTLVWVTPGKIVFLMLAYMVLIASLSSPITGLFPNFTWATEAMGHYHPVMMVLTGCFYLADMVYELVKPNRIVMCEN